MKNARQAEILNIIQSSDVETQEQLLFHLKERGFNTTQATISRDIKELRLVKELTGNGGYRYAASGNRTNTGAEARLRNIFKEGFVSVDVAQNIIVLKTMPGLASAVCSALDGMDISGMVGTIAGDDTGLIIMRDNTSAQYFSSEIHNLLH